MGRSGKSLWNNMPSALGELDANNMIMAANELYTALDKFQGASNTPRSFF
jgi:hypothetical protein